MSNKVKYICIFVILPLMLVAVFAISILMEKHKAEKQAAEDATTESGISYYTDEEISQMLLDEFERTKQDVVSVSNSNGPLLELSPDDAEYDDMIDNSSVDLEAMAAAEALAQEEYVEGELTDDEEAIILAKEQESWKTTKAKYTTSSGIEVVTSMNQVSYDGDYTLTLTADELAAEHPLFLQYDSRWASYPYGNGTMKSSACGPTCFSMVIVALTDIDTASPPVVATYSMNHGHYVSGAGTAHSLFLQGCSDFGLYCYEISNNEAEMKSHLDNGEMLILSVHYGNFTHSGSGHFIVIYGYDANGFMVNDPGSYDRSCQYWTFETITGDINKIYTLGRAN